MDKGNHIKDFRLVDCDRLANIESQLDNVLIENVYFRETIDVLRHTVYDLERRINKRQSERERYFEAKKRRIQEKQPPPLTYPDPNIKKPVDFEKYLLKPRNVTYSALLE